MSRQKGYLYLFISMLVFSTMEVTGKFISNQLDPLQINFLRFLLGGLTSLPFAVKTTLSLKMKFTAKDIAKVAALGILLVPVSMSLFQFSIFYTKASITAVLISCNAIFTAPLSFVILKERIDKYIIISLLTGVIVILIIALPESSMNSNNMIGILLGIASSITFSLYTVLGKKIIPTMGGLVFNTLSFLFGSIAMIPILVFWKIPLFRGISVTNFMYIIYIGTIVTAFAYIFMFKGFSILQVNAGSLVFFAKPIFAGILSFILLGETFTRSFIAGSIFIMIGIFALVVKKDTRESSDLIHITK